jgi:mannosyltransferase
LRFYKLGEWSFWIDEIYTIDRALFHYPNLSKILENIPPATNWVPLSSILTAQVLNNFGISEWSARLVSATIGVITIPILYFPMRKIFGYQVTLTALLLIAVSPWHIYWSQNARFYTSLVLLSTLALFAFYQGFQKSRLRDLLLFFILFYLATSERSFTFFILPIIFTFLVASWFSPVEREKVLNKKLAFFLFLPILAIILLEIIRYVLSGTSMLPSFLDTFYGEVNTSPLRLALSIIYRISVPVFSLGIFGGLYFLLQRKRASLFVFICATLPPILLIFLSLNFFAVDRYIFISLFFWMILAAMAINGLFQHTEGIAKLLPLGVLSIVLFSSLSEIYLYYQFQNGNRPNWKEAYTFVEQNIQVGDIIYTTSLPVGNFYLPEAENRDIKSFKPTQKTNMESNTIWFVIDENTGRVEQQTSSWIQNNCIHTRSVEVFLPGKSMSIRIYRCSISQVP